MRITPLGKYILVKVTTKEDKGGIVTPDSVKTEDEVVEVLAVGHDVHAADGMGWNLVKGMRILCIPGTGIPTPDKSLVLVREADVVAIVKE